MIYQHKDRLGHNVAADITEQLSEHKKTASKSFTFRNEDHLRGLNGVDISCHMVKNSIHIKLTKTVLFSQSNAPSQNLLRITGFLDSFHRPVFRN
jgi:hypothetical protein